MKLAIAAAVLLLTCGAANASTFALLSMQYSADQFVPHVRLDGVIAAGDAEGLAAIFDRTLGCVQSCTGPSAVLTLNSLGGNFVEAQAIAEMLRARHIATVIEGDQVCYGACVVAFTGGSALAKGGAVVADRTVVPGARIGVSNFNQPHEGLARDILTWGIDSVLGGTPEQLEALASSGQWGVSSMINPFLNGMMTSGLDLATAEGLYLLGARLPAVARKDIEPDQASAVLNACSYLIARHEHQTPGDMIEQLEPGFLENFPPKARGDTLMGYTISGMQDFNFCGIPIGSTAFETITLYQQGDEGIREVDSQKVELATLLDPFTPLGDLAPVVTPVVEDAHFHSSGLVYLTQGGQNMLDQPDHLQVLYEDKYRRTSSYDDMMIYEQAGGAGLLEAAVAYMKSPAITKPQLNEMGKITLLQGTYADSGNAVAIMTMHDVNDVVVRIELGTPWDAVADLAFVPQYECGLVIGNLNLECE